MTTIFNIPIEKLHPHARNPRTDLGDLTELAASIKANGVMQNLTVVDDGTRNTRCKTERMSCSTTKRRNSHDKVH